MSINNDGLTKNQENALRDGLISIIEADTLPDVWQIFVEQIPKITNWDFCSIYLQKDYLDFDPNQLVDSNGVSIGEPQGDYVVLAQTNIQNKKNLIGKAFYPSGIGLTGMTFKKGKTYLLEDVNDKQKLKEMDPDLESSDRYGFLMESRSSKVSMLLVPLISNSRTIGVLKLHTDLVQQSFSQDELLWVSKMISVVVKEIVQKYRIPKQEDLIFQLVELATKEKLDDVFQAVTNTMKEYLECAYCEAYLTDDKNETVELKFINGKGNDKITGRKRGEGLIGWIFQTGRPLLIDDIHKFNKPVRMDQTNLDLYSDGLSLPVDEDAEYVKNFVPEKVNRIIHKIPFLAVPIQYRDQSEILGILCVHYMTSKYQYDPLSFKKSDLNYIKTFAGVLALAIHNDNIRRRNILLTRLGKIWNVDEVLDQVSKTLPTLLRASFCYIFLLENVDDGSLLRLKATNVKLNNLEYKLGEGKTGFCGKVKKTLVFSHYGSGVVAQQRLEAQKKTIQEKYYDDLVETIVEDEGKEVGIAQIWSGRKMSKQKIADFHALCSHPLRKGLVTPKIDTYEAGGSKASYSFIAVPIVHSNNQLDGVITVRRPIKGVPFSGEDVQFVEAIATNLGAILDIVHLREDSEELYQTLTHEINTPLTSIRVDADLIIETIKSLLKDKDPRARQLEEDGKRVIRQVDYLQMLSDTIMSLQKPSERTWYPHSILRPIHEAIDIYGDYAKERGCEIHPPKAIGYPGFPDIYMAKFELTLAFKNLIHNAIKYSYRTSIRATQKRYISIIGKWIDQPPKRYSISIQNYGVPIVEEEIKEGKIFQRGYRGIYSKDRDRRGAGIGLSLVKHVIEDIHNGSIFVTSIPLEGTEANITTFTVVLPIEHPEQQGD